ncbi:GDSL esterase/lipase At5g45670-like [Cynara cardunculus var. scolymus]|uniref:GDSL esterase/lipase At5g45670-like n=1 Tax=Cynara cardunculus var. scolymus TaxID=59895 RepID=UPI000D62A9E5|nr:GDSL esterase/lipase At5g45670-like [Cynara cardunculus var. scolymus]
MGFGVEALVSMLMVATLSSFAAAVPQVPCYFVFGDSLMDNGNNNDLVTNAKSNVPPYGIDFPDGPTGRFSNGRNTADAIAQLLGFESYIPPFATAKPEEISRGVNYASGAAGIRDETAEHLGGRISMNQQLINHATTISRLNGSSSQVQKHLNKCIYTVTMGNNDFINNYFLPQYYQTNTLYTPQEYANILVQQYTQQLSKLHQQGARMFGIAGAGYSGCAPAIMTRYKTNVCVDEVNLAVLEFNTRLVTALKGLESRLFGSKFIFIEPSLGYSSDFSVTDKPCCIVSTTIEGEGQCIPNEVPCSGREKYVFWDAFHPTEGVSLVEGARIYKALSPFYGLKTNAASMAASIALSEVAEVDEI